MCNTVRRGALLVMNVEVHYRFVIANAQIDQGAVVVLLFVYFWHVEDDSSCTVMYIKARGSVKPLPVKSVRGDSYRRRIKLGVRRYHGRRIRLGARRCEVCTKAD